MGTPSQIITVILAATALLIGVSFVDDGRTRQLSVLKGATEDFWALIRPGGQLHPSEFIAHRGHLAIEGLLVVVISYLLFQSSFKPKARNSGETPLSEKEIQELCDEWEPEPLWGVLTEFQQATIDPPVVTPISGTMVQIDGKNVLNMVSLNFLGLAGQSNILEAASATIQKYGVGSCGPRGFYGTVDVHLELEQRLAAFLETEETIMYSYDLATLPSIIPAFANKRDVIICDEGVNYAIQNGCNLSRARVMHFKHNDLADLERMLQKVVVQDKRQNRPLTRRFIVVEGIYANHGDMAPLPAIIALKNKYKYRLVVDESIAFGALGTTGKGAAEHAGASPQDVEIIGASLGNALASVGGFCAGEREIVDHQRLSGAGYCFSASLPPYLATAAIAALDVIESNGPALLTQLHFNARLFRTMASKIPGLKVVGGRDDDVSPLVHLRLSQSTGGDVEHGDALLQRVVEHCWKKESVLFTVSKYSHLEKANRPPPSIRVAVTCLHTEADLKKAVQALSGACRRILC